MWRLNAKLTDPPCRKDTGSSHDQYFIDLNCFDLRTNSDASQGKSHDEGLRLRIAIVHDWLVTYAGAERVLSELLDLYPDADLFSVIDFLSDADRRHFGGKRATTTFIQRLPFARKNYRSYLPLMPLAIEQLDLSSYDLVISSSHAVAKGVLTGPDQLHISYVHSPMRYAWDLQHQYLRESNMTRGIKSWLARWRLHKMRLWDVQAANSVDHFVCNSRFVARRLEKTYRRSADVIYPPVDVEAFTVGAARGDYYMTASRLVPYKRIDLIMEAFARMPEKRLIVIGDGPGMEKLRKIVGKNVELLGHVSYETLKQHMQMARAFVFAAEEDFGITPVEAQACGTPVIAFGKGGSLETVVDSEDSTEATGIWFKQQTVESLIEAINRFESLSTQISPSTCRAHAENFSRPRFRAEFSSYINKRWDEFQRSTSPAK